MKIAIIGNCGSGKSTLALELHKRLNIPLYHLDQYFWKPGWQEPCRDEFEKIHHQLCNQQSWIIEGMAIRFLEYRIQQADMIIFLDQSTLTCLYRIFKRAITFFGRVYFSSAPGCPERGPDRKFVTYVRQFNNKKRPEILALIDQYKNSKKIFTIKNNAEIDTIIQTINLLKNP